ncbi:MULTISPECIES: type 1 glutamine amidotransferase domain-containing protein [unclassified Mucilaginibacter]|uniref:type 1 glutamine amidotransferase domain-containing protein n=1 Tax=unclassified Mucilaginibacter TaxID=2617802 RepID=UPI0033977262
MNTPKKVLIVVTSFDEVKSVGKKTGLWLEEFSTPYYLFTGKGIAVTIASPRGGKSPIDPKSLLPDYITPSAKRFLDDKEAQERLNNTVELTSVKANDYDAIFYPGGHGPMWDLPENEKSIELIETFYNTGKPVAMVCHAPAVLKNVKAKNGDLLIKGKTVAGFTNTEEAAGQSEDMVPFLLEDMLISNGGNYKKGEDWKGFMVNDGLLITGQNPASAELVGEKIVELLKVK